MLISAVRRIVGLCSHFPWPVISLAFGLAVVTGVYAATHFAITTDINKLIAPDLGWRQREIGYEKAFPGGHSSFLVVIDAPTPELATEASNRLVQRLQQDKKHFHSVEPLDFNPFFARNGLLFLNESDLAALTQGLGTAAPVIGALNADPSLRGLTRAMQFALLGVEQGRTRLDDIARVFTLSADTLDKVLAGAPASFSWRGLLSGHEPAPSELRHYIEVQPVLDYSELEPGRAASDALRAAAADLKLITDLRARLRLTGPVAMADDEFGTVREGAVVNAAVTIAIVLVILWLALRSARIIAAVAINLFVGLAMTAAVAFVLVGALNLISIAFAVLFIGLGVDFGIQFAVRYRSERFKTGDLHAALDSTASRIGAPLTLAAAAVAAGFLSFYPTDYKGVSELGEIAGIGMLIAFFTSITVLPALLAVLQPPGEPEQIGYRVLAPVDRFLARHRIPVIVGTGLVALAGVPLLFFLHFDFNPINLRNPQVESVATFLDLRTDPTIGANAINVVLPSVSRIDEVADRLRGIPEVEKVTSVKDLVPANQERKLALIHRLGLQLQTALEAQRMPPPTDAQTVTALRASAEEIKASAAKANGFGAEAANRLAADMLKLADAGKDKRAAAETAFIRPLETALDELRNDLKAGPVALDTLPADVLRQWVTADGRTRVQAFPKGDPNDNETLRRFARAIQAQFPEAVGVPVSILESGKTIVGAFFHAGGLALVSIAILLWIVLRRLGDVLLTLVPLLLAGLVTLELCVLLGLPLNFANIIALPLLLGVGVAFKIYYIMAWRAGQTDLLQSSLTRAVIWSALTTATAFGSLWVSNHPGTSSMGKLLALSLVCTMAAAVLFQPALMGKPRQLEGD
jgi:hopanoid biosynthesis associated RND transporter like protein HpnN